GNAVAVPDEAVLTLSGTRSLPGKTKTDNAEGAVDPLVLDIRAITASAGAASVRGQAQHAEAGASGPSAPRSEKSAEPVSARADLRTEAGMERWSVPVEVKTAERATPAAPGQVFSRLTETQRQMVVENFSQAVLPGLQGGRETLTVDLNPPELGRVQVHVEKAANGNGVNAVLTMQDRAVGEFFQGQTDVIRKTLEEAGIQVGGLSVEIRQQFNQEAREKTSEGVQKASGNRSGEDAHRAGESRKAASVWASSGLSRVEIMV
ncbi:MAG: flagellar hook-length control protein FliK, partial [Candidatus Firestonebacteria bacterium]|nr:flagellar hook-length control protein FliK [Candidatus Firestonebacteria bacterium]